MLVLGLKVGNDMVPRIDTTLDLLRTRIRQSMDRGDLRLPPETELAAELGVSRSTLREALALLESEGVLRRVRSQGTFIRPSALAAGTRESLTYPIDLILSFADYLAAHGIEHTVTEFFFGKPTASNGHPFGLAGSESAYRTWRVFEIEGQPAAYLEHIIPTSVSGVEIQPQMLVDGVTAMFDRLPGVRLESIDSTIGAEAADERMAGYLDVPQGTALVTMVARMFDVHSDLIGVGNLVFRPDVLSLSVRAVSRVNVNVR